MITVKFKKLSETAIIPEIREEFSNTIVFRSPKSFMLQGNTVNKIETDLAVEMTIKKGEPVKAGLELQISNPNDKLPSGVYGILGTVDVQYRGNVGVLLVNLTNEDIQINQGDIIAYGKVNMIPLIKIKTSDFLSATHRGEKGFGHSGV